MDIGSRIRDLRKAGGLTLEELASRCELTKGFLSQVERNLTSPSISTLEDILEALGTSLPEFFQEKPAGRIVFGKEDYFVDEREEYSIEWIVPNAQKNEMEPILLHLRPGGKSFATSNHEGQEFGYVIKGTVWIQMEGGAKFKVQAGETFYLDGEQSHTLVNASSASARVIWVSTPPVF